MDPRFAPIFVLARIAAIAAVGLGALALVLAMTGLYGVLSHLVARRRREVGVRMALGASGDRIARMIMREGFRPVLEGLVLGLAAGAIGRLIVRAVLNPDLSLVDPLIFTLVPLPLYVLSMAFGRVSPGDIAWLYVVLLLLALRLAAPRPRVHEDAESGRAQRPRGKAASSTGTMISVVWLLFVSGRAFASLSPLAAAVPFTWRSLASTLVWSTG